MRDAEPVRAVCLCGRVTVEARLPAMHAGHCHCSTCRRAHGAGVVTWVTFPAEEVRITAGKEGLVRYHTETDATRSFCGTCGSTMLYESPRWPGTTDVAAGCVLGPIGVEPSRHWYASLAPKWCPIHDDLPRMDEEP